MSDGEPGRIYGGDFQPFGEYEFKPPPYLPDVAHLHGYDPASRRAIGLRVTKGRELVALLRGPVYYKRRPVLVPSGAPGILQAGGEQSLYLVGLDVVNTSSNAATLKLYHGPEDTTPVDAFIFGALNESVGAGEVWSWRGALLLEEGMAVWGLASASSALRAALSVRYGRGYVE
jgi:hypothetical protein